MLSMRYQPGQAQGTAIRIQRFAAICDSSPKNPGPRTIGSAPISYESRCRKTPHNRGITAAWVVRNRGGALHLMYNSRPLERHL